MKKRRILVVEDEASIRAMLTMALTRTDFTVDQAADSQEAQAQLTQQLPDLILLDWMLPGKSGIEFIRDLKASLTTRDIPIILLTARAEEEDKIKGLDSGADDYIVKPFSPRELISRIQAVLRRGTIASPDGTIHVKGVALNPAQRQVLVDGEKVNVSHLEYKMLYFFMRHQGKVYSRNDLISYVWGVNCYVDERTVDVQIKRLRRLLGRYNQLIKTVRGVGYQFNEA